MPSSFATCLRVGRLDLAHRPVVEGEAVLEDDVAELTQHRR